ncbi:hypothetical protein Tco_0383134 [Tanacetum coccineum]
MVHRLLLCPTEIRSLCLVFWKGLQKALGDSSKFSTAFILKPIVRSESTHSDFGRYVEGLCLEMTVVGMNIWLVKLPTTILDMLASRQHLSSFCMVENVEHLFAGIREMKEARSLQKSMPDEAST